MKYPIITTQIIQPAIRNVVPIAKNFIPKILKSINKTWDESYDKNNIHIYNPNSKSIPPDSNKINIVYKTTFKVKTNIVADLEQTISDVILLYLKKEGKEKLFKRNSDVFFLYNAQKINIFDKTRVKDFFKNKSDPLIIVHQMKYVLGA